MKLFQRQPNGTLICLKSKAPISDTTSRLLQDCNPMLPTKIFLLTRMILVTFQAKMLHAFGHAFGLAILCFVMLLTQYAPNVALIFLSHSNVAGIFSGTKQGGRVYRIAGRCGIFRLYRPVRYGINNLEKETKYWLGNVTKQYWQPMKTIRG